MAQPQSTSGAGGKTSWSLLIFQIGCHALVVVMLTLVSLYFQLGTARLADFQHVVLADGLAGSSLLQIAAQFGIVAVGWALAVFLYVRAGKWKRRLADASRLLSRETGSVLTETLIVFPVALFLVFALAQLAINNTVGMLANLATFQASRSAWIWVSEAQAPRLDGVVNPRDAVRTQVAAVMTPVAPGNYLERTPLPERAEDMRAMFVGSQMPVPGVGTDRYSYMLANQAIERAENLPTSRFTSALDSDKFIARSAQKFTLAYHMTQVRIDDNLGDSDKPEIRVRIKYHHRITMPMVGAVFGRRAEFAGMEGYFSTYERSARRRLQPPPSQSWPEGQPIRTIPF